MLLLCPYLQESTIRETHSQATSSLGHKTAYFPTISSQLVCRVLCSLPQRQIHKLDCCSTWPNQPLPLVPFILSRSSMKSFQLNKNKKHCPSDLAHSKQRQISTDESVRRTDNGEYPIYILLSSFREDSFQKEKSNNTFKIVLNMQLRTFSSPFQSSMSGSIPESRRSGQKALFKTLHEVTEHDCGMRLLS